MQIGVVAKKIGLRVDAIRFYERNGLLPKPPRTEGGFRRFGEGDVETLAFVRRVQGLGFKLSEIGELLRIRGNQLQPCASLVSWGVLSAAGNYWHPLHWYSASTALFAMAFGCVANWLRKPRWRG